MRLYSQKNLNSNSKVLPPYFVVGHSKLTYLLILSCIKEQVSYICHDISAELVILFVIYCRTDLLINMYCKKASLA